VVETVARTVDAGAKKENPARPFAGEAG